MPSRLTPTHGYIGQSTFATYHRPAEPVRSVAYVICPPLGYEAIECYHSLWLLAQRLAAAGFHTLRVDYHGTGESLGTDEDPARLEAWLGSIRGAMTALEQLVGVEGVALLGVRLGGTLATKVASERKVDHLVLWEPCSSGATYVRELEIIASASAASRAHAAGGGGASSEATELEAAGYVLTGETTADLTTLTLEQPRMVGKPDVLWVERDDRPSSARLAKHFSTVGCETVVERLPGFKEMMVDPAISRVPEGTLNRICERALQRSRVANGTREELTLGAEASEGILRHRAIRFGPGDRLFGVLTEPIGSESGTHPTVLILSGGVVPRTAVNRMYVPLARRLAELGHSVLRMDVSGIAESLPAQDAAHNDPFSEALLDDVLSATAWLSAAGHSRELWLIGLCSGAYASFQAALADEAVIGTVLINPLVFYWKKISSAGPTVHDSQASRHYGRSLLSASKWKRLLSGHVDLGFALRAVSAPARTWFASRWGRDLAGDLRRLSSRGVGVRLAFSQGDPGYDAFMTQVGRKLNGLQRAGLSVVVFEGADHTFGPQRSRAALLQWIVDRISTTTTVLQGSVVGSRG